MATPVVILPAIPGRTFIESGLIAIQCSRERLFRGRPSRTEGEWMDSVTLHHEWIHFLQSITCASVHYASQMILWHGKAVLSTAPKRGVPADAARALREAEASVYAVGTDDPVRMYDVAGGTMLVPVPNRKRIKMLDVMEGVAVLESYRLCTQNTRPEHFLEFRDRHFPGERNGVYRRSFDFLANAIGVEAAFELLPPVSFLALQEVDVGGAFVRHTEVLSGSNFTAGPVELWGRSKVWSGSKQLDLHELTEYGALLAALELDDPWALPHAFACGKPEAGHITLDSCAALAVRELGLDQVVQLGAVPHRATRETFDIVRAPLTVYSGDGRTILEAHPGLDTEVHQNVIAATSIVGAALRLIDDHESAPYQFCPQAERCPYYENALCHRQFAPPRSSRSHELCGFPKLIQAECGMDPTELWDATGHAFKTPEQLVEAFEATHEAGLLHLCRKQRGSLTKWLGEDGYREIEWRCDATLQTAHNAIQTQKMEDAIEARAFRDAVVEEIRQRAKRA
jgi:hypothetical protein